MIWIKSSLFVLIIVTVKYIFKFVNDYGDKCINNMKELIDFTNYLKLYSCQMKMSYEEIFLKYSYKNESVKNTCSVVLEELEHGKNKKELESLMKNSMRTPEEFNKSFADILDYYGSTYSDALDNKLCYTLKEMESVMKKFENSHNEKKNLNNRISILVGCLTAVIFI